MRFILLLLCLTMFALPALAQVQYAHLTEDNITAFIEETARITSGAAQDMQEDETRAYLERHLHDKARFKSAMRYNIPGMPTKDSTLSLDKEEYMDSIKKGASAMSDYQSDIEIEAIKLSRDRRKATVTTLSREQGVMPVNSEQEGLVEVPITGTSACTQILTLEDGVIQMFNATCKTVIEFLPY